MDICSLRCKLDGAYLSHSVCVCVYVCVYDGRQKRERERECRGSYLLSSKLEKDKKRVHECDASAQS